MAYSKRDLIAFVQAVENLRLLVDDLRAEVKTMKTKRGKVELPDLPPLPGGKLS